MSIREIPAAAITDAVEALCIEANTRLPADVKAALDAADADTQHNGRAGVGSGLLHRV